MGHHQKKQYILDTNVHIHDPKALLKFGDNIVSVPLKVSEEIDKHKEGSREKNRNAREAIRILDSLTEGYVCPDKPEDLVAQIELNGLNELTQQYGATGQLYLQNADPDFDLPMVFDGDMADNSILRYALAEKQRRNGRPVILVTKDANLRVKARMLGLEAQDYRNEAVSLEDVDVLAATGIQHIPDSFWSEAEDLSTVRDESHREIVSFNHPSAEVWHPHQGLVFDDERLYHFLGRVAGSYRMVQVPNWHREHQQAFGIRAQNLRQAFALHLCLDPNVPVVFLLGKAGTGKTLIALASGLQQVLEDKLYTNIIATRAAIPVGEDIGFLPGDESEKMGPWMGAIKDNLEVITDGWQGKGISQGNGSGNHVSINEMMLSSKILLKSPSFMRGRTFLKRYLILDEAQNLTPKQMTTLLSRIGPGSKVIVLGNVKQIDNAYLRETDNGLSVWASRFMPTTLAGHVILQGSVRSEVAEFVESF